MRLDFTDGSHAIEEKSQDTFFVGFNRYLFLRRSCYQCKYTGTERVADITLADFWGVDLDKIPDEQRKYGVSLILVNTDKGKRMIPSLRQAMYIAQIDRNDASPFNQALERPSTPNVKRSAFFSEVQNSDFDKLVHKYNRDIYFKLMMRSLIGDKMYEKLKCILKIKK